MDKDLLLTLGKLLVAVAWTDGELRDSEKEVLNDLIFTIPDLSREDLAKIHVYMESEVTPKECRKLAEQFKATIKTEADKTAATAILKKMIYADGTVADRENTLYSILSGEISTLSSGLEKKLEDFLSTVLRDREAAHLTAPHRERDVEAFLDHPVFYRAFHALTKRGIEVQLDKSQLYDLCAAGALMASIAQADKQIHPNEVDEIKKHLKKHWDLTDPAVDLLTEIAIDHETTGMDLLRLSRVFYENSNAKGRIAFIKVLAEIVKADEKIIPDELIRLQKIATYLRFPQDDLMALITLDNENDSNDPSESLDVDVQDVTHYKGENQDEKTQDSSTQFADI